MSSPSRESGFQEFGFIHGDGTIQAGFNNRPDAIRAARKIGQKTVNTVEIVPFNLGYFARFEAGMILRCIDNAARSSEQLGRVIRTLGTSNKLQIIERADFGDGFPDDEPLELKLKIDLMNRIEEATSRWIEENRLTVGTPGMVQRKQVHLPGTESGVDVL